MLKEILAGRAAQLAQNADKVAARKKRKEKKPAAKKVAKKKRARKG